MIERKSLFDYIQNVAVSCVAIHSFVLGFHNVAIHKDDIFSTYPKLEYLFFVLPIVYHKKSMEVFKVSHSIVRALEKDKFINIGLQERAIKMIAQTYDGLNLSFNKEILNINKELMTIELLDPYNKNGLPLTKDNQSIRNIQRAASNLGNIFAKTDERSLQSMLNIRF